MEMGEFLDLFNRYARSELMILVPVLIMINSMFHNLHIKPERIPLFSCMVSCSFSALYTFATVPVVSLTSILLALFTSFTQGILFSGASMFVGIMLSPIALKKLSVADEDIQESTK